MNKLATTIAAISTPPGKGGVAVIRVSGPEAFAIARRVFRPRGKKDPFSSPRVAIYGDFLEGGKAVDDGLMTAFPAPASYTGEDTVELSCHGGVLITQTVLGALLSLGAVPAAPGEFTRRAYLSGRLGLTEAEAIASLLEAKSTAQVRLSASRGLVAERLRDFYRELLSLVSAEEALIDFPEEDLSGLGEGELYARLSALREGIRSLLATYRTGHAVTEGIRTVIVGRPNVGKSSLYNLLLGEEAAIVSDLPGTTRDVLSRTVPLGRVLLQLSDTAGLRESCDPIERIGVERAHAAIREADLLLAVFDASAPLTEEDRALFTEECRGVQIAILNKSDLPASIEREEIAPHFSSVLSLSAKEGEVDGLRETVEALFTDGELVIGDTPIIASARQHAALARSEAALTEALSALSALAPADMVLYELTAALSALGEVDGHTVGEEIVSEIFSHFCVGK